MKIPIPCIHNIVNITNINKSEKIISAPKLNLKEYHDKRHHAKNISLQVRDRVMIKDTLKAFVILKRRTKVYEVTFFYM